MNNIRGILLLLSLIALPAPSAIIFETTSSLSLSNPTQVGRLSRNGLQQDWAGTEAYPGVFNTATTYRYTTYSINVGLFSFIQIDFDSTSPNTFVSAYDKAYLPDSAGSPNFGFNTNWLGDAGSSGNFFGVDPLFFNVIVPANDNLVVVINTTAAINVGVGDPFHLTVEGFYDSSYNDTVPPVPEPATIFATVGGLAFVFLKAVRARTQTRLSGGRGRRSA